ncbi:hypothetical protein [Piscinibacter sp. XHJ-5]|uniref:hypothetical protein n=1 Tax=Piscinibacter sp. XHJ-5 TaxID=3037797 RepID=UPI00245295D7|nr:hypothetical protein [Piscinibacter sp. XHJ-5]
MLRRFLGCVLLLAACAFAQAGAQSPGPASASAAAAGPTALPAPAASPSASDAWLGRARTSEATVSSDPTPSLIASVLLATSALLLAAGGVYLMVAGLAKHTPEGFSFRRHMGGFGGGSTGWQLSEQLVGVLCGLVLVALATAIAMQVTMIPGSARTDAKGSPAAGASAASAAK